MRQIQKSAYLFVLGLFVVLMMPNAQAASKKASSDHAPAKTDHGSSAKADSGHQVAAKDADHGSAKKKGGHGTAWGYSGKNGPANWGKLAKDYHACLLGTAQSPIGIGGTGFDGTSVAPIAFDYRLSPVEILNNGHTIQVNYAPGSGIEPRGKRFELLGSTSIPPASTRSPASGHPWRRIWFTRVPAANWRRSAKN